MKKTITSLLLLAGLCATAQVKIGDNPTTISPGAALEIESTNKGLVIPRVANTAAVLNPVNGMMVYDISSECFKGYQNGEWSGCGMTLSATASILAQIGAEGDSPNIVPSQITAAQLYSLGVTSIVPAYEGAYQNYIDAHPDDFSNPASMSEVQAMITAVNAEVTDILTQIGNEGDNPNTIVSIVTVEQLEDLGITGVTPGYEVAYQDYIDTYPDAFGNPASIAQIQALVTTVNNTVTGVLAQIGNEGDSPDTINSVVTASQLQSIGITGVTPANETAYQEYIDTHPNDFSSPATLAEIQAMVTAVNDTVTDVLAQIGAEGDSPDTITSVVTAEQLESVGITGVTPGYEVAYQDYIDTYPNNFSDPATLAEIQAMVTAVNDTVTDVLAQIGAEGDSPDTITSVVTAEQLESVGITGVTPGYEVAYQDYIDNNPNAFSDPATLAEIQAMVTAVNDTVTDVLAQIGTEGDSPDTITSVVTAEQLESVGITGVTPENEVAYQDYIDNNPNAFSDPATLSEIQAMVTAVNDTVTDVLAQIGAEGDSPDTITSVVTAEQLESVGITGVTPGYEVAYQDYIDNNPNAFSDPATLSEIQAMITAVNASAATSGGTATVSGFNCNTASAGTLTKGTTASGVTQTITATVTTAGTYNITATANGVTFTGTGTFSGTGPQAIVLTANGTPTAAGSNSFTLSTTPGCSFSRSTIDAGSGGTAAVNSWSCGGALTGAAVQGLAVSGLTKVVTANVTTVGSYSISAVANGITFSASGTFAGTGSQDITLTANGIPTAAGTHSFTINSTPGCSFSLTTYTVSPVSYVQAARTGTNQILSQNSILVFNTNNGGTIPMNTSTGEFTLTAGKTYRLTFHGMFTNFVENDRTWFIEWVNSAGTILVANANTATEPLTMPYHQSDVNTSDILYTPATNEVVKLKVTWTNGTTVDLQMNESTVLIQELGVKKTNGTLSKVDYIMATKPSDQTVTSGSDVIMTTNNGSNNIPLNTSTGEFTLTGGKTYRLYFQGRFYGFSATTTGEIDIAWVNSANAVLAAGTGMAALSYTQTFNGSSSASTEIVYTPATTQTVKLRVTFSSGNAVLQGGIAIIQELGVDSSLGAVAHNFSNSTGSQTGISGTGGANVKMDNTFSGSIPLDTTNGYYTLTAGKTYRLTFTGEFTSFSSATNGYTYLYWVNYSNNAQLVASMMGTAVPVSYNLNNAGNNPVTEVIYTPATTQTVIVRTSNNGAFTCDLASHISDRVIIQELGVSAN